MIAVSDRPVALLLERQGPMSGARIGQVLWPLEHARRAARRDGRGSRAAKRRLHELVRRGIVVHDSAHGLYALSELGRSELQASRARRAS